MSCLGNCYLPIPPRDWSRVQSSCSMVVPTEDTTADQTVISPLTHEPIPISRLRDELITLRKGNVLQYKKNSSNLTNLQRYSLIAKGKWTNRNTTWATQSQSYTNPNTKSLARRNSVNVIIPGLVPTTLPVTCPTNNPAPINDVLPTTNTDAQPLQPPPPPVVPVNSGTELPPTIPEALPDPIVIEDGGILICNIQENNCTGEQIVQPANNNCHPTTDSDVPGQIIELCWNNRVQTWYPRERRVMSNSANKWPTNSKAIFPVPPCTEDVLNNNFL